MLVARYRGWTERAVARRMTRQQIQLYFHWSQRDLARQQRIDEATIGRAINRALGGDP